jgi:uncharacterized ferritin-like protein (DUF455 family)
MRERTHRDCNAEVQTLEIAAQCLVDYPEAPWELRMDLARQCWDEARHAALLYECLYEWGGYKGEFPIANLDWSVVCMVESLPARLVIQHRTLEAGSLDLGYAGVTKYCEDSDPRLRYLAELTEAIDADEIQHVRFANEWLRRFTKEDPRTVLQVAAAMNWLRQVINATGGPLDHTIPTAVGERALAGFTPQEVAVSERLEQDLASNLERWKQQMASPPPNAHGD